LSAHTRVVVGVSGTPTSHEALRIAVAEARRAQATLVAVLAWAPEGGEIAYGRAACAPPLRIWEDEAAWRLRHSFEEALGGIPGDLAVELLAIRGASGPALVDTADRPGDLLVVGAGAHGRVARLFHGATARYCAAHAACRVLTVPAPYCSGRSARSPVHG
jgi:nucleotide-binding universal stress UspA family protein